MAVIKKLDRTGHTTLEVDASSETSMAEARELIESAFASSALVFDTTGATGERIATLEAYRPGEHQDVTIVPAFQGG